MPFNIGDKVLLNYPDKTISDAACDGMIGTIAALRPVGRYNYSVLIKGAGDLQLFYKGSTVISTLRWGVIDSEIVLLKDGEADAF